MSEDRRMGFTGYLALLLIGAHFWDKVELGTWGWVLVVALILINAL